MILLSLNTGLIPGELCRLAWEHINFSRARLTVLSYKRNNTRCIPLSREVLEVLQRWRYQNGNDDVEGLVFLPHEGNVKYIYLKHCWQEIVSESAIIEPFCWHNMRSHIANRLEIDGVGRDSVKEWLGIRGT